MDSSPPMLTTNTTSDTLTRIDIPRSPTIPPHSLSLLRTWSECVVGASLDVWSMFPYCEDWRRQIPSCLGSLPLPNLTGCVWISFLQVP
eukprot:scaffold60329_cov49-Attheya_sp.AAC.1